MAAQSSRSSRTPRRTTPPATGTSSRAAVIAMAVLCVTAIAVCAILLSYNGIFQIALRGGVTGWVAHLYPGVFILLLLMAFWAIYLLREAPRRRRIWVDLLVLVMILAAAAASALHSFQYELGEWVATLVVAGGPWLALLISFRLLLWIVAEVRSERVSATAVPAAEQEPVDAGPPAAKEDSAASASGSRTEPLTKPSTLSPQEAGASTGVDTEPPSSSARDASIPSATASAAADPFDGSVPPVRAARSGISSSEEPAADREDLPKRVPAAGVSAIRRAAEPPRRPVFEEPTEPAAPPSDSAADAELDDADWESITDAEDDWETSDAPLVDDPAGDETHPVAAESTSSAPTAPPPSGDTASAAESRPATHRDDAADHAEDTAPQQPSRPVPALQHRPIMLKPRRSSPPPLRPPSSEVRSSPIPPKE